MNRPRLATLFSYDWDAAGFARQGSRLAFDRAGFDLFSFPSNARIVGFDLDRFAERQARRGKRRAWAGVVSHHEQYGALAAALVAERLRSSTPSMAARSPTARSSPRSSSR
jgi:hypothetical protein